MTHQLLSPKAIADYLNIDPARLRAMRRSGAFPLADARIRSRLGWSKFRLDWFAVETWGWKAPDGHDERVEAALDAGTPDGADRHGTPLWWLVEPTRYLNITDLAAAANLQVPALWSYYYKGHLSEPDVMIGHRNRIAGWTPTHAAVIARAQGWDFDLARLPDLTGIGAAL